MLIMEKEVGEALRKMKVGEIVGLDSISIQI